MRKSHLLGSLVLCGLIGGTAFGGCSVETITETVADDDGAGGSTAAATGPGVTSGGPGATASSTGTGAQPDESTGFTDAVALEEFQNNAGGVSFDGEAVINPAGDEDFFKFEATAGQWIQLITIANEEDDTAKVDTVITLYGPDQQQVAEVDDAYPRITTDSELFYRVKDTGTHYVKVQEFSSWNGDTPEGDPTFAYRVVMIPIDFSLYEGRNLDAEPNDTTAEPQDELSFTAGDSGIFGTLSGVFDEAGDVDVYEVTAPAGALTGQLTFTPSGPDGYGSTLGPGIVSIYSSTADVWAQLDVTDGSDGISMPVTANETYYIAVNMPEGGSLGANPFYFLKFSTANAENPQETDDEANDDAGDAEVAVEATTDDPTTISHFIGGNLGEDDTDWWSFEATTGDEISVVCSAQRSGSGVLDMMVEAYASPTGDALESETETATKDLLWSNTPSGNASKPALTAGTTGTHYLKLSATTLSSTVLSNYYICGIHVSAP